MLDTPRQLDTPGKRAIAAFVVASIISAIFAWRDLNARPEAAIRGSRLGWRAAILLNTGNSFAYWLCGRRRGYPAE